MYGEAWWKACVCHEWPSPSPSPSPQICHDITGLRADLIEPGRVICSLIVKVPARLLNENNSLLGLGGASSAALVDYIGSAAIKSSIGVTTTGVSTEVNLSYLDAAYLDEGIEIQCKVLRVGKNIAVVNVELRKKINGKIIAQGRHTEYLPISSKL